MKTQLFFFIKQISFFILISCFLFSCKKKDEIEIVPEIIPTGTVMFHLHTYIGDNEVDLYNIPYSTQEGRNISLRIAQLFISDVQLVKLDNSTYDIPHDRILKTLEKDSYLIGQAPVGNYKGIRFKLGLSSLANKIDPAYPADSAMWFSSANIADGYVFLNVQGMIDTSETMSGNLVPFAYKIGTNANYKQINLPEKNFTIVKGEVTYAHLMADYNRLFNGINLTQNSNLFIKGSADNATPLAQKIVANLSSIFIYEP